MRTIVFVILCGAVLLASCNGKNGFRAAEEVINPRDTVVVPEGYTGEDSIAYIEDVITQSPITAADLLALTELHYLEHWVARYDVDMLREIDPDNENIVIPTRRDSAAMRLGNRLMRMGGIIFLKGNAKDMLEWPVAMEAALDTFRVAVPNLSPDSALYEIPRVMDKFSSQTQMEMNYWASVYSMIDYFKTIKAYRQWIADVPDKLKPLALEEYEAWFDLNEARFYFWKDVSYNQGHYSMKPMEIHGYYGDLAENRRAELAVERDIVLKGKPYEQKGKTVTTKQWEKWIADCSVPLDIEFLSEEDIPSDSLVADRVDALKSSFARWLAARQALAEALPEEQGKSYDSLTADIHRDFLKEPERGIDF